MSRELAQKQLPTILFIHGFTSAKEHNLHYAYYLAEQGFRVILPEASMHGERCENVTEAELNHSFWEIVLTTIEELDYLVKDLSEKTLVDSDRIGLVGTSMGGIATLGALTQYDWIKVAVSLMGCPAYVSLAEAQMKGLEQNGQSLSLAEQGQIYDTLATFDLSQQPEKLKKRPLLFWHSEVDDVVPFEPAYTFYLDVKRYYAENEHHLKFIKDETSGHKVSRSGVLETVRWFKNHL